MSGWGWDLLVVFVILMPVLWLIVAAEWADRDARQDAEHRASWLPRTDPSRAEQLRDQ